VRLSSLAHVALHGHFPGTAAGAGGAGVGVGGAGTTTVGILADRGVAANLVVAPILWRFHRFSVD
jgi:hypothetical protein